VPSIDYPHNTLLNITTETGLIGLLFFTLSQLFLIAACRKLLLMEVPEPAWWGTFISIFAAYWVFGLDVSSGLLSELNIWYMFALAICFRYAYGNRDSTRLELIGAGSSL
jgi:O-antigen ligase